MPMSYGCGAYGGSPSYPNLGDDDGEYGSPDPEPKQSVWYWICRIVGSLLIWVGLPVWFVGGMIASVATPSASFWERNDAGQAGFTAFFMGLIVRIIGFIIKKE